MEEEKAHTEKKRLCEDRGRDWSDAVTSHEMQRDTRSLKKQGVFARTVGASMFQQHLEFRFQAFRTVRE